MDGLKIFNTVIIIFIFLVLLYEAMENDKIRKAAAQKAACTCNH